MKDNPKYQSIFKTGKELFWKYGIKRVTIEEICKEAKVSKMTFYKFFPNKIELAKTILGDLMLSSMNKFDEIIARDMLFSEKLEAVFLLKIQAVNNFSKEFINDIYNNQELGLKAYLEDFTEQAKGQIIKFYSDAQAKGHIRKEVNIDFIMAYSSVMPQFMKDESLMGKYNKPIDFILEMMNLLFYGIITGNE
jgi:AcrR family transcriptional regulator